MADQVTETPSRGRMDIRKIAGGVGLVLFFIFRETVAWAIGQILNRFALPRDAAGQVNLTLLPWGDIVAWTALVAGIALIVSGALFGRKGAELLHNEELATANRAREAATPDESVIQGELAKANLPRAEVEALLATLRIADTFLADDFNSYAQKGHLLFARFRRLIDEIGREQLIAALEAYATETDGMTRQLEDVRQRHADDFQDAGLDFLAIARELSDFRGRLADLIGRLIRVGNVEPDVLMMASEAQLNAANTKRNNAKGMAENVRGLIATKRRELKEMLPA